MVQTASLLSSSVCPGETRFFAGRPVDRQLVDMNPPASQTEENPREMSSISISYLPGKRGCPCGSEGEDLGDRRPATQFHEALLYHVAIANYPAVISAEKRARAASVGAAPTSTMHLNETIWWSLRLILLTVQRACSPCLMPISGQDLLQPAFLPANLLLQPSSLPSACLPAFRSGKPEPPVSATAAFCILQCTEP